jgi:hypothetical protein
LAAKSATYQANDYPSFVDSFKEFLKGNEFDEVIVVADQFIKNIITNDRSVLEKVNAKVFDYVKNATSVV